MEGAIVLLVLMFIGILLVPIIIAVNTNNKINAMKSDIGQIKNYLRQLQQIVPTENIVQEPVLHQPPLVKEEVAPVETRAIPPDIKTEENVAEVPIPVVSEKTIPDEIYSEPIKIPIPETESIHEVVNKEEATAPVNTVPPSQKSVKKKTNFEQFIGEKLISIVGIAILVLGIFFTVKWAIDKKLINDAGKILIGLLSGTILIATAHRLSKNYRAFSSILAGGGIAVFYFSIYEAYQTYHLLPQTGAFAIMVLITLLAVIFSIFYDKKELAIIAIIGGFSTPFFVSNGSGNYQVLFSYMLILNVGMFCLAYFKKWNIINIVCYGFTILIFGVWTANEYDISKGHDHGGFLYVTFFFLVFFGMNIIYNLRYKQKFAGLEIGLLLSNSFFYLGLGLFFLKSIHNGSYQGVFTILLAAFNFVFAFLFFRRKTVDKNLIYLLIALVLTFLSLTGPIQLEGNYITLFWACEMVILYWLGIRSDISVIKNSSVVILILTLISLTMDWQNNYYMVQVNKYPFFFNKAFITGIIVISALFLKRKFVKLDTDDSLLWGILPVTFYRYAIDIILVIVMYNVGFLELQYQTDHTYRIPEFSKVIAWAYQYVFAAALLFVAIKKKTFNIQKIVAIISCFLLFLYIGANSSIANLRDLHVTTTLVGHLHAWHYLIPIAAMFLIVLLVQFVRPNYSQKTVPFKFAAWFLTTAFIYILSSEIIHIWIVSIHEPGFSKWDAQLKAIKIALPILWSISSLTLMIIGMRRKIKILRIISLSLFTLTILKLFIYDISNVTQGGKIAAFIILGVILLLVSFLYQKIKGLFIEEEDEQATKNGTL